MASNYHGFNQKFTKDFSRNGTFVNEEKIGTNKKRILRHGDIISIAYAKMQAFTFRDHRRPSNDLPEEIAKKYYKSTKLGSGACTYSIACLDLKAENSIDFFFFIFLLQ